MSRANAVEVGGVIVEVLPNRSTYKVELANGHRVLAFVTGKARSILPRLAQGEKVTLEMSLYDLSIGRIISAGPAGRSRGS